MKNRITLVEPWCAIVCTLILAGAACICAWISGEFSRHEVVDVIGPGGKSSYVLDRKTGKLFYSKWAKAGKNFAPWGYVEPDDE